MSSARLLLLVSWLGAAAPAWAAEERQEGFGRWQVDPKRCELALFGQAPRPCRSLRIDQRNASVLRFSLIAPVPDQELLQEVSFVGERASSAAPLRCSDGVCKLDGSVLLRVRLLRLAQFNPRGLVVGFPKTLPVVGTCSIDGLEAHCDAQTRFGERWSADAVLR
ncbi:MULTISPECIES: hypothetical protein [unclassified Synechococcus]|uniref:hypothetical protein n=1 Tax=unclassified Synechococcus TaxID=2626047 RepID=UPI0020017929|nr:hypothetical protein [Synechococcus sp. A10-1-5-1]UPM51378.1 hypothetical protein MY494_06425 [Synechococcus sp. A10-1-5-1]